VREQDGAVSIEGNITIALLLCHAFGDGFYSFLGDTKTQYCFIHFSWQLDALKMLTCFSSIQNFSFA